MKITNLMVTVAQRVLNELANLDLRIDGALGPATINATIHFGIPEEWSTKRKVIGTIQHGANEKGIEAGAVDGYYGSQTDFAYDQLLNGMTPSWRKDELGTTNGRWPMQNQKELIKCFGQPGENQGKVYSPYPLKIAWETSSIISRFTCHEKLVKPIANVLERVLDHYGDDISFLGLDMWGGCYNLRKMRGGNSWSTHAWGIAIDWDPIHNQLRWGSDQANFSKPEYEMWWKLWEEEGAISLGREKNYDFMHVQFANVQSLTRHNNNHGIV